MFKITTVSLLLFLTSSLSLFAQVDAKEYDVVIYGGTSAGISSAIQCSRLNKTVLLIEPTNRIGGLI